MEVVTSGPCKERGASMVQCHCKLLYARLKQWRGIAPRYEKQAVNYRVEVVNTSLMIWTAS